MSLFTAEEVLSKSKRQYEAAVGSDMYTRWLEQSRECYSMVDGNQWTPAEEELIRKETGVEPVTVNKLYARLANVSGLEIQTRTKLVFRPRSENKEDAEMAESMSDVAMFIQDKNNTPHVLSRISRDSRICGLGWHSFDVRNGVIKEKRISPLEVYWDVRDPSQDLSGLGYCGRHHWVKLEDAIAAFPDKHEELEAMKNSGSFYAPTNLSATHTEYAKDDSVLIVEHEWREPAKYYEVVTAPVKTPTGDIISPGKVLVFWKLSDAEKAARGGGEYEVKDGFKVYCSYFTGSILLDWHEYKYQIDPSCGYFSLTPFVCAREEESKLPYGVVRGAISSQRLYNKTKTRLHWMMAARQVLMEGDVGDIGLISKEVRRPDGILLIKPGRKLEIDKHNADIAQHIASLQQIDRDIQDALGIYDESMGVETNAQSGVAIQKRQTGSNRNQAQFLDDFMAMKKVWAQKFLGYARQVMDARKLMFLMDDENKVKRLGFNEPIMGPDGKPLKDASGKEIVKYDIAGAEFDVYVQEVPDTSTQLEGARQLALDAMGKLGLEGLRPEILELMGVPSGSPVMGVYEKIRAEGAQQQIAATPQGQTGIPSGDAAL